MNPLQHLNSFIATRFHGILHGIEKADMAARQDRRTMQGNQPRDRQGRCGNKREQEATRSNGDK